MTIMTYSRSRLQPPLSYLVLVEPNLVAIDIRMTIAETNPRARIIVPQDARQACEALKSVERLDVAFLGLAPESEIGIQLAAAVRARGGRLVFIGDEAEKLGYGADWTVLIRPFTTNCVLAALAIPPRDTAPPPMPNLVVHTAAAHALRIGEDRPNPFATGLSGGLVYSEPNMLRQGVLPPPIVQLWSLAKRSAGRLLHRQAPP